MSLLQTDAFKIFKTNAILSLSKYFNNEEVTCAFYLTIQLRIWLQRTFNRSIFNKLTDLDELRESLEISKEQEATLCAKAEKEEASVSELITRLLHFGEEAKRAGEVRLDSKKFAGILSCANDKDLVDGSRKFGETLPVSDLDL